LSDRQLDEQLCSTFAIIRQRLYEKNTIIAKLRCGLELERSATSKQYQALQQELANEKHRNGHAENGDAMPCEPQLRLASGSPTNVKEGAEDQTAMAAHFEQSSVSEFEQALEQSPKETYDTGAESTGTEQSKQSPSGPALRQRRLGRGSLVGPLTIIPQIHTPSVQVRVEGFEDGRISSPRKRVKRLRRY
jgi:hypothetical protein